MRQEIINLVWDSKGVLDLSGIRQALEDGGRIITSFGSGKFECAVVEFQEEGDPKFWGNIRPSKDRAISIAPYVPKAERQR